MPGIAHSFLAAPDELMQQDEHRDRFRQTGSLAGQFSNESISLNPRGMTHFLIN
jgi:hypothetical protein